MSAPIPLRLFPHKPHRSGERKPEVKMGQVEL